MRKKKRGGKRKGAGRPKTKEDTKVMRVPVSKVEEVKKLVKRWVCTCIGVVTIVDTLTLRQAILNIVRHAMTYT